MTSLFTALCLLGSPDGADSDLSLACTEAARQNKMVLVRQILCDCREKVCAYADLAARPPYLENEATRKLIARNFVIAVSHVSPDKRDDGFHHAGYVPSRYRRVETPIRTLFVTPRLHLVHRLDLCPYATDVEAEAAFALRVHREAYGPDGVPLPDSEERVYRLHFEHGVRPESCHAALLRRDARPWTGSGEGISWTTDLSRARAAARETRRLVLYFQVVGDLDQEGC